MIGWVSDDGMDFLVYVVHEISAVDLGPLKECQCVMHLTPQSFQWLDLTLRTY